SEIGDITKTTTGSLNQVDERPANFVPYDDPPVVIGSINPVYPEFAKRNGVQGTVVLEVEVLKDGSIRNIHVKRSVPGGLDEAAIEAVRKVKFQPGKSSGQPVDVLLIIPVEFKLN
ncbi:MAG: energy transducer TonB, partial [Candidatus Cloacimonadaceae bacterium]|nr:energy transducer TonB [Candidatus Cloacimonadaceae bacterium]